MILEKKLIVLWTENLKENIFVHLIHQLALVLQIVRHHLLLGLEKLGKIFRTRFWACTRVLFLLSCVSLLDLFRRKSIFSMNIIIPRNCCSGRHLALKGLSMMTWIKKKEVTHLSMFLLVKINCLCVMLEYNLELFFPVTPDCFLMVLHG